MDNGKKARKWIMDKITPKEALDSLRKECHATYFDENGKQWWTTDRSKDYRCNAIEQALANYENLKTKQHELNKNWKKCCEVNQKQKQILEVLKKSAMELVSLEIEDFGKGKLYRVYDGELYMHIDLTKEEFNLLKEWLNNA